MRPPNTAALPLMEISLIPTKVHSPPSAVSMRATRFMEAPELPVLSVRLLGKGTDSTGSSGASMNLVARIDTADGGLCTLVGMSEISMSGKAAVFGGRMMSTVADQILQQFAANFAAQVSALQALRASTASASDAHSSAVAVPALQAKPLNVLALAWTIFKGWLRGLRAKKTA